MIVTRFAPSPTGYLHLGHAFAAMFAHQAAREAGSEGRFLLRIEDLDSTRVRENFAEAIGEDLHWLGLVWDGAVLRQSDRFGHYRSALDRLREEGLLYPCFCTRREIAVEIARAAEAPHGPDGVLYPGTCRLLPEDARAAAITSGTSYALRLDSRKAAARLPQLHFEETGDAPYTEHGAVRVDPLLFGDVVLSRKETPASYHLAVVVDDAAQEVTLVTRGQDLFPATHVQRVLQALLGVEPPVYRHHRLILDESGRKLSKRDGATALRALRKQGISAGVVRARLLAF